MHDVRFHIVLLLCAVWFSNPMVAQEVSSDEILLQVRPRSEWRDGYQRLRKPGESGNLFTQQRTRFTWQHSEAKWTVKLGFQDVRSFGDPAGRDANYGDFAAAEAWGAWKPTEQSTFTFGRQIIAFDNERIVGAVNWSQHGRFLDGIRWDQAWRAGKSTMALTWDAPANLTRLMFHHTYQDDQRRISLLHFEESDSKNLAASSVTSGLTWQEQVGEASSLLVEGYAQKWGMASSVSWMGVVEYVHQSESFGTLKVGADWLEGASAGMAFYPFLGTNHRHYGWMDHFYVGMPADGMFNAHVQLKKKLMIRELISAFDVRLHRFHSSDLNHLFSHELDAVWVATPTSNVKISLGWSIMTPTDDFYAFQSRLSSADRLQHWGWVELDFHPKILMK